MDQHSFWIRFWLTYLTLAFQRITSYTRGPKISSSSSEWGGQGKVESTLMAHTCGCEKAAQAQRGGGLQAEGCEARPSAYTGAWRWRSAERIRTAMHASSWANTALVAHVWQCLQALLSRCIVQHVDRGLYTNLLTRIMVIKKLTIDLLFLSCSIATSDFRVNNISSVKSVYFKGL